MCFWNSLEPKDKSIFFLRIIKYILVTIFLGVLFYKGFDYFKKYVSSISVSPSAVQIHFGERDAIISRKFSDASQACWHYYGDYKHLHPYILWGEDDEGRSKSKLPRIRVIAKANWSAQNCVHDQSQLQVKLLGIEFTEHRIEAQLSEDSDFVHIADSKAYYGSELIFDSDGRIKERKILSNGNVNCRIFDSNKKSGVVGDCRFKENKEEKSKESRKRKNVSSNELDIERKEGKLSDDDFMKIIGIYINKRNGLHTKLKEHGCGVITIEPVLENIFHSSTKPAIAFLCFKDHDKSHVRLMIRE